MHVAPSSLHFPKTVHLQRCVQGCNVFGLLRLLLPRYSSQIIDGLLVVSATLNTRECPTMRFSKTLLSSALILATALSCPALTHSHRGPTSQRLFHKHTKSKATVRSTGQRTIDDARATQIQASLIKSGYLTGETSGHWDSETEAAMQKYQSDNGWQTKLIPDSRAIIKLGLGPTQDSALNNVSSNSLSTRQTSPVSSFMQ